jgi:hypothetical protein
MGNSFDNGGFKPPKKSGEGPPKLAGNNTAINSSNDGTTLILTPPFGSYDGINTKVTHTDANRIAANIKAGVTLDGVTGAYDAKRYSSGSVTSSSVGLISVSNLVILSWANATYSHRVVYHTASSFYFNQFYTGLGWLATSAEGFGNYGSTTQNGMGYIYPADSANEYGITMTSGGFSCIQEGYANTSMNWYAWEA